MAVPKKQGLGLAWQMPCGVGRGTHRSWPGGRGGRPSALVAGEGWWLAWQFHRTGQVSNADKEEKWRFLKDALWVGG